MAVLHRKRRNALHHGSTSPVALWAKWPRATAFLMVLLLFLIAFHEYFWLPAYHDAALHWQSAFAFFERPWFPFVVVKDTGHPPLVAWTLAALWHLPVSKVVAMHVLSCLAVALLLSSVFDIGRASLGFAEGLCMAAIVGLHPVVLGQSLQLNLDLFQIAFAWAAVAALVAGKPVQVAVALSASVMTKLNGLFAVPPVALFLLVQLQREGSLKDVRRVAQAMWPVAIPIAVFVAYHAIKYVATGRFLVGPEFRDENLGHISSLSQYAERLGHSLGQTFGNSNPNMLILIASFVLALFLLYKVRDRSFRVEFLKRMRQASTHPGDPVARSFFRPLLLWETALLSALLAACHLGFWTLRQYFALVRHMMGVYPALALFLVLLAVVAFPKRRRTVLLLVVLPVLAVCYLTGHPGHSRFLPKSIAAQFHFPPSGVSTNHENNLEIIDELTQASRAIEDIEKRHGAEISIDTPWPFDLFFTDPSFGMVKNPFRIRPGNADVIFRPGCSIDGPEGKILSAPPTYKLDSVYRMGRITDATFVHK